MFIIYGYGRIGKFWHELVGDAETVAIVDPHVGGVAVPRLTTEIARQACAVIICTPTYLHCEHVCQCLRMGLHVLCEKPLSLRPEEITQCFRLAKKLDLFLLVGLNRRWDPLINTLPRSAAWLSFVCQDHPEPSAEFLAHSGGVFHDCMIHELDILDWHYGYDVSRMQDIIVQTHDPGRPHPNFIKTGCVSAGVAGCGRFVIHFTRLSDRYVHSICDGRGVHSQISTIGCTFMTRFRYAFEAMLETFRLMARDNVINASDRRRVPTENQCLRLCRAAEQIQQVYF